MATNVNSTVHTAHASRAAMSHVKVPFSALLRGSSFGPIVEHLREHPEDRFRVAEFPEVFQLLVNALRPEHISWLPKVDLVASATWERLGSGSFGTVFAAVLDLPASAGGANALVAVKEIACQGDSLVLAMRELAIMSLLSHKNILSAVAMDWKPGKNLRIVMPFADGGDLTSLIPLNPPLHWKVDLIRQIAEGLRTLHDLHVIHRDIKPANVLICWMDGQPIVKLADFGVSNVSFGAMMTRGPIGTPQYCAPELFTKKLGACSVASDVYSFAVMVWAILHAKGEPYGNFDLFGLKSALKRGTRPTPDPTAPATLIKLMKQAWAQEPEKRITIHAFLAGLVEVQASIPVSAEQEVEWLRQMATLDHPWAMIALGVLHYNPRDPRMLDESKAKGLFERAETLTQSKKNRLLQSERPTSAAPSPRPAAVQQAPSPAPLPPVEQHSPLAAQTAAPTTAVELICADSPLPPPASPHVAAGHAPVAPRPTPPPATTAPPRSASAGAMSHEATPKSPVPDLPAKPASLRSPKPAGPSQAVPPAQPVPRIQDTPVPSKGVVMRGAGGPIPVPLPQPTPIATAKPHAPSTPPPPWNAPVHAALSPRPVVAKPAPMAAKPAPNFLTLPPNSLASGEDAIVRPEQAALPSPSSQSLVEVPAQELSTLQAQCLLPPELCIGASCTSRESGASLGAHLGLVIEAARVATPMPAAIVLGAPERLQRQDLSAGVVTRDLKDVATGPALPPWAGAGVRVWRPAAQLQKQIDAVLTSAVGFATLLDLMKAWRLKGVVAFLSGQSLANLVAGLPVGNVLSISYAGLPQNALAVLTTNGVQHWHNKDMQRVQLHSGLQKDLVVASVTLLNGCNLNRAHEGPRSASGVVRQDAYIKDFTVSALYYDPIARLVIDPTGKGVDDVRARRLRPCVSLAGWLAGDREADLLLLWLYKCAGFSAETDLVVECTRRIKAALATPQIRVALADHFSRMLVPLFKSNTGALQTTCASLIDGWPELQDRLLALR